MNILLTRPQERQEPLKSQLIAMGHSVHSYPLLKFLYLETEINTNLYDGIVLTSPFAAYRLTETSKPIFAVGDSLKKILPSNAFIFETVDALKKSLPKDKNFLYLKGKDVSDNLDEFSCVHQVVYQMVETEHGPIDLSEIESVVLFSVRTAEIFEKKFFKNFEHLKIFTLSDTIANKLQRKYKEIFISSSPNLESFLDLFK